MTPSSTATTPPWRPYCWEGVVPHNGSQFGAKGRVIRGRKAIRDRFAEGFKTNGPALDFTITTLEVWLVDDLAYESGNYTLKLQPKGKDTSSFAGNTRSRLSSMSICAA